MELMQIWIYVSLNLCHLTASTRLKTLINLNKKASSHLCTTPYIMVVLGKIGVTSNFKINLLTCLKLLININGTRRCLARFTSTLMLVLCFPHQTSAWAKYLKNLTQFTLKNRLNNISIKSRIQESFRPSTQIVWWVQGKIWFIKMDIKEHNQSLFYRIYNLNCQETQSLIIHFPFKVLKAMMRASILFKSKNKS